ncbi:hypothetical protein VTJ04DRAFT_9691 [Mycothermus thermophilus]|uniref:uncharacterized protein n=1 Tax=Humicola insolens TaxID=85995 RepID=UPI0037429CC1
MAGLGPGQVPPPPPGQAPPPPIFPQLNLGNPQQFAAERTKRLERQPKLNFRYAQYRQHGLLVSDQNNANLQVIIPGQANTVGTFAAYPVPLAGMYPGVLRLNLPNTPDTTITTLDPHDDIVAAPRMGTGDPRRRLRELKFKMGHVYGLRFIKVLGWGGEGIAAHFSRRRQNQDFVAKCTIDTDGDAARALEYEKDMIKMYRNAMHVVQHFYFRNPVNNPNGPWSDDQVDIRGFMLLESKTRPLPVPANLDFYEQPMWRIFDCFLVGEVDVQNGHAIVPRMMISDFGCAEIIGRNKLRTHHGMYKLRRQGKSNFPTPEQFSMEWDYLPRWGAPYDPVARTMTKTAGNYSAANNVFQIGLPLLIPHGYGCLFQPQQTRAGTQATRRFHIRHEIPLAMPSLWANEERQTPIDATIPAQDRTDKTGFACGPTEGFSCA